MESDTYPSSRPTPPSPQQLAEALEDLGYGACESVDLLLDVLKHSGQVGELEVAYVLGMMTRTSWLSVSSGAEDARGVGVWNVKVLVDALRVAAPALSWPLVMGLLDNPCFECADESGLLLILKAFRLGCQDPFPVETFLREWRNSAGQLAALRACLRSSPEVQETVLLGAGCTVADDEQMERRLGSAGCVWSSGEVVRTLVALSEKEGHAAVQPLLDEARVEGLLLGLVQCWPSSYPLHGKALSDAFSRVARGQDGPERDAVMRGVWGLSRHCFAHCLWNEYQLSGSNATAVRRCLSLAVSVGCLEDVLSMRVDGCFVLELAMYADAEGLLSFSQWLRKFFSVDGDWSARACTNFLGTRVFGAGVVTSRAEPWHVDEMMRCLDAGEGSFGFDVAQGVRHLKQGPARARLLGGMPPPPGGQLPLASGPSGPGSSTGVPAAAVGAQNVVRGAGASAGDASAGAQPGQPQQPTALFAPDIEEEANSHFQRIYTSEIEIERVIQMLKGFKTSTNQREQEVFACMIHNLFDEYRFFPRYPERELLITGKLFGSLIQHQLVSSITLGIALRYVLEALRKPFRTNMFKFGMCALEQFKSRLVEWPQYCHHINQIAHIRESHKDIIEYIQRALANGRQTPVQQGDANSQPDTPQNTPTAVPQQNMSAPAPGTIGQQLPFAKPSDLPLNVPSAAASAQAQAYGAFGGPGAQAPQNASGPYGRFTSGFGQDAANQLPNALQNLNLTPADNTSAAGGADSGPSVSMDMRNSNVQNTLSIVTGAQAFGSVNNVDMLLQRAKQVVQPDMGVQDKVHFVFNNLSNTNLDQKEKDLLSVITEQYVPWMCQYIVIKRAAQEANYHNLYVSFVDKLDKKIQHLLKGVVACTIENIKVLLADDKITSSSSVRSLLKNLGSWLGAITLMKNKPILQKDLDFKQLMVDAYEKGRLIAYIPFIAKVLDNVANSRIFRPPNPWTMLILSMMAELHPLADLKLNIKFEIEVLCKNLNRDIKDIKPSTCFKNKVLKKEGNPDFTSRDSASLSALKPLPTVPDERLMAAAAGLGGMGAYGGLNLSGPEDLKGPLQMPQQAAQQQQPQVQQQPGGPQGQPAQVLAQGQQPQPGGAGMPESLQNINMAQYVTINPNIMGIFQQYPQMRAQVIAAINQAISEIILPVVERSVTIACITTRELILKDFAFESDENSVKMASHVMVQNLAGSLALVTCKEPLRHSMTSQLRNALMKSQVAEAQWVEQAAQVMAQENLEVGCNLIETAATEKALRDIDFQLAQAMELRRAGKSPMHEQLVQMQNWLYRLPEALRPKSGSLLPHQKRVYEDFTKLPSDRAALAADPAVRAFEGGGVSPLPVAQQMPPGAQSSDLVRLVTEKCTACMNKAEEVVLRTPPLAGATLASLPQGHELTQLIVQARALVLQCAARDEAAVSYSKMVLKRLYDSSKFGRCPIGVEWMVASLVSLNDITKRVAKEVTTWMAFSEVPDRRLNRELAVSLVTSRLLVLGSQEYVKEIIKVLDMGRNQAAVDFLVSVLQHCLVDKRIINTSECVAILEALTKVAQASRTSGKQQDACVRLLEQARKGVLDNSSKSSGAGVPAPLGAFKSKETPDPPGLREQILFAMEKWVLQIQSTDDRGVLQFMQNLLEQGWLKGDEITDRFFRICVEICVDRCTGALADPNLVPHAYVQVDAFSKLVLMLVRYLDDWNRSTSLTKVSLLNKALATTVKVMHQQHAERKERFNQKPFHRLMTHLLLDMTDAMPEAMIFSFADALQACQPRLVSGFSFAWLELVSHRSLMPRLLQAKANKGWNAFQRLLIGLFKYMEPYLRNAELHEPIKLLYKGTLRVLLVLLHDFPEFLCEYHFSFCDAIPPSCIQLRNLILSAFPRHMSLPDPFTPQLKVDLLPEITKPPAILSPYSQALSASPLRVELDKFLKGRGSPTFLASLPSGLLLTNPAEMAACGTRYNVPLISSLVLYTVAHAISQNQLQGKQPNQLTKDASMDVFRKLCRDLDTEGRYLFLNAVANQLRYPNSHTHYLSCVLLGLFQQSPDMPIVREQITRVLIERLIVNKPHPWGLLITFIELIKNPSYDFWHHDFVRSSKEIEALFQSVARFCLPQQQGGGEGEGMSSVSSPKA